MELVVLPAGDERALPSLELVFLHLAAFLFHGAQGQRAFHHQERLRRPLVIVEFVARARLIDVARDDQVFLGAEKLALSRAFNFVFKGIEYAADQGHGFLLRR